MSYQYPTVDEMYEYLKRTTSDPFDWLKESFHYTISKDEVKNLYKESQDQLLKSRDCIHLSRSKDLVKFEQQPYLQQGGYSNDLGFHVTVLGTKSIDIEDLAMAIKAYHNIEHLYAYRCEIVGDIQTIILPEFAAHPTYRLCEQRLMDEGPLFKYEYYSDQQWSIDAIAIKIIESLIIDDIYFGKKFSTQMKEMSSILLLNLQQNDYTHPSHDPAISKWDLEFLKNKVLAPLKINQISYINATEGNFGSSRILFDSEHVKIKEKFKKF